MDIIHTLNSGTLDEMNEQYVAGLLNLIFDLSSTDKRKILKALQAEMSKKITIKIKMTEEHRRERKERRLMYEERRRMSEEDAPAPAPAPVIDYTLLNEAEADAVRIENLCNNINTKNDDIIAPLIAQRRREREVIAYRERVIQADADARQRAELHRERARERAEMRLMSEEDTPAPAPAPVIDYIGELIERRRQARLTIEQCPCCFEETTDKTKCNHPLCKECEIQMREGGDRWRDKCPICRASLTTGRAMPVSRPARRPARQPARRPARQPARRPVPPPVPPPRHPVLRMFEYIGVL